MIRFDRLRAPFATTGKAATLGPSNHGRNRIAVALTIGAGIAVFSRGFSGMASQAQPVAAVAVPEYGPVHGPGHWLGLNE